MKKMLKNLMYGTVLSLSYSVSAQTFTETMGSVAGTTSISVHESANGFSNVAFTMSGTGDVRATSPSTNYPGFSAGANIFLTNTVAGKYFQIEGINTATLTGLSLSFGVSKSTTLADGSSLVVSTSTDGIIFTPLAFPLLPTGGGSTAWQYRTCTGTIPSVANLYIRFTNNTTATQFRIDDVKLSAGTCTADITAGGPLVFCNGGNVNLSAPTAGSYLWTNVNTGATLTTQNINVSQSGTYSLSVTYTNGCVATAGPVRVLSYPNPALLATAAPTAVCAGSSTTLKATTPATDLFFSEYVEGQSFEKYIEIFNGTGNTVILDDYVFMAFHNGTVNPTYVDTLAGPLLNNSVIVLQNPSAFLYGGGIPTNTVQFNGNDALALYKISTNSYVDIFGVIGSDPGSSWTGTGGYTTVDNTLRRKPSVYSGITINPALPGQGGFSTLVSEWDLYPVNTVSDLGTHTYGNPNITWSPVTSPASGNIVTATPTANTQYVATASFIGGCSATATVDVTVLDAPSVSIDIEGSPITLCYGDQFAQLVANASGGTAPYTYLWSEGTATFFTLVTPTVTTAYSIVVTDNNGCSVAGNATVEVIDACCEGTNVIVCIGSTTMCLTPDEVPSSGGTVGPCETAGRAALPAKGESNNTAASSVGNAKAFPNPFNGNVTLSVKQENEGVVNIEIVDFTGKKVAELHNSNLEKGTYEFNWDGRNSAGSTVANGLYICRIVTGTSVENIRIQKTSDK